MDVAFSEFRFDSGGRRLLRRGEHVRLSRKAYELLEFLITCRPRALSKAELQEHLWPGSFVVEANLSNLVAEIRAALRDDPQQPRFIRTVHSFGYAFCGEAVQCAPSGASHPPRDSLCWLTCGNHRVQLPEGEHLIGRHPASILVTDSPSVSRHHASIRVASNEAILTDLGSRNGTYVCGRRIETPTQLQDRDEIRVGAVVFAFRVASLGLSTEDLDVSLLEGLKRGPADR